MMKEQLSLIVSLLLIVIFLIVPPSAKYSNSDAPTSHQTKAVQNPPSSLQIPFIENRGQIRNGDVRYYADSKHGAVYVTGQGEIVYSFKSSDMVPEVHSPAATPVERHRSGRYSIKESLLFSASPKISGEDCTPARISYFRGKRPVRLAKWPSGIR